MKFLLKQIKNRNLYLNRLIAFKDKEPIKIVTGIRRCGKSTLLELMIAHLLENGVKKKQILKMNFESFEFSNMTDKELHSYVMKKVIPGKRLYLFFDEPQKIQGWENVINSFRVDIDCDIYITGSNSKMLSSEYSTYLSGRYVEIKMLPLSFSEFLDFNNFKVIEKENALGETLKTCSHEDGNKYDINDVFQTYLKFGGMPGIAEIGINQEKIYMLLDGIYNTVITKDILGKSAIDSNYRINDPILLNKVCCFLADNIGNETSYNSITNSLKNTNMIDNYSPKNKSEGIHKIQNYVNALVKAFFFYEAKRFDIVGKELLKTNSKFYIVDTGFKNYLLGYRNTNTGFTLENIVYLELLRRGYNVSIGKVNNKEVDFRALKNNEVLYIQVTEDMNNKSTQERELAPFKSINDNYEKIILTNNSISMNFNGIKVINIIDWLLNNI